MTEIIRRCTLDDVPRVLEIVNAAAVAYRGVIPADCWHAPYMSDEQLRRDIRRGVSFVGMDIEDSLAGVMGVQTVDDVDLVRHAYVLPGCQSKGVGTALLRHLMARSSRQLLVGTWSDATWAISFYQRHGFAVVDAAQTEALLKRYWNIPQRQTDVSVVLSRQAVIRHAATRRDAPHRR